MEIVAKTPSRTAVESTPPLLAPHRLRVALVRGPLVSTTHSINNEPTPSIGLAYLAGYLRHQGYAVTIIDAIGEGLNRYWTPEGHPGYMCQGLTFSELVNRIPPDVQVIGFSVMFSGEWPVHRDLIAYVKERFPKATFLAGGEHITSLAEFCLKDCPALDICVRGEGEQACYELLENLSRGESYDKIRGLCIRTGRAQFFLTPPMTRIRDLNRIPWPYWPEGYLDKFWSTGKAYGVCSERDMPLMVSRGCPYGCTFCTNPVMWTRTYWLRDPDDVIAELQFYKQQYQITSFQLYDLTAITKRSWTIDFCNKLLEHKVNLTWSLPVGTRSEALDGEVVALLKRTGCNYLVYAPESGSLNTLKAIKKQVDLSHLTASVLEATRQGVVTRTNLIIGFPHETRHDVYATLRYSLKLAFSGVDEVGVNIFSPYPGSEIFKGLRQQGKIQLNDDYFFKLTSMNGDYAQANFLTFNPSMGPKELALYRFLLYVSHYVISYVIRPSRIFRTVRYLLTRTPAATVFEVRLKGTWRKFYYRMIGRKASFSTPPPVTANTTPDHSVHTQRSQVQHSNGSP